MSTDITALVSDHLDLWTSAIERKSGAGRGGGKRVSLYGIERLRALVLDLAVRGKLLPQDANDEPAMLLLERISAGCALRSGSHARRAGRQGADDHEVGGDVLVPKGWQAVPLSAVATIIRGVTYGKSDARDDAQSGFVALLRGHNIQSEINLDKLVYVPAGKVSPDQILKPGDIVVAMSSGSADLVGKAAQYQSDHEASFGAFCGVIRPVSEKIQTYLAFFCRTPFYRNQTHKGGRGIGIQNLSKGDLENLTCLIPPEAEQQRIVAKVDELMALCDALEAQSASALAAHQALVETLLASLVNSDDATELATNWARLESYFDALFTTEVSIDALKQTVLDLAVRGKLVRQDEHDEPASVLLKKISASNAKRVKAGQAKAMRSGGQPSEIPMSFAVPDGWAWAQLGQIAYKLTDGAHHTPTYTETGVPFLSVKDMSSGKLDFSDTRFISALEHESLFKRCDPEFGDLLITKVGTTGVPVIVDTDHPFSLFVSVALVKAPWDLISVEYLRLLVDSPFVRKQSADGTQGIGNKNLVLKTIGSFYLPIAPLAEQRRIVAKVDELMALCDALKARLGDAAETQKDLADAVVERAAA